MGRTKIKSTEIKEIKYGPLSPANRTDEAMVAFRNYGLGQFIHWGLMQYRVMNGKE